MLPVAALGAIFTWLLVISYFLYKERMRYQNLTSGIKTKNLDEIIDTLIKDEKQLKLGVEDIKREIQSMKGNSKNYLQKIGLVRFNPFGRSGSDQSFVLSLLNQDSTGIVINFIYTHEGVRVYTKRVKEGKGVEHSLSEEEKHAVDKSVIN